MIRIQILGNQNYGEIYCGDENYARAVLIALYRILTEEIVAIDSNGTEILSSQRPHELVELTGLDRAIRAIMSALKEGQTYASLWVTQEQAKQIPDRFTVEVNGSLIQVISENLIGQIQEIEGIRYVQVLLDAKNT